VVAAAVALAVQQMVGVKQRQQSITAVMVVLVARHRLAHMYQRLVALVG